MTLDDVLLSGEIADFVRGRDRWPSAQEWEDAGQRRLYVEMMRGGGPRRWLEGVHLAYQPTLNDIRRETTRVQLARFLQGRADWPDAAAFAAAGKQRLHELMIKAGGEDLWAEIFGFPTSQDRELDAAFAEAERRLAAAAERRAKRRACPTDR